MTKVAVTGGAGFIGSNLVQSLIADGHDVIVVDDLSTGLMSNLDLQRCTFHEVSIVDREALSRVLAPAEVIFHLGARGSVPRSIKNPVATHDVNATGTFNVFEIARHSGAHVIFSSSSSVYGRNTELPKDESMWLGPMSPYAASKLAGEAYAQSFASSYGIPTTILRFFNVFGPRQRPDHEYAAVIPKWIWNAKNGEPIEVYGDGTQSRDFTYVQTVVEVCMDAMKRRVTHDGPVNLAFGERISLLTVIELLRERFPDLEVNFKGIREGDIKDSLNDPILLKTLFPKITPVQFSVAFAKTFDWLESDGDSIANKPLASD